MAFEPFPGPLGAPSADWSPSLKLAALGLPRPVSGLHIIVVRTQFTQTATRGHLLVDDQVWGFTLEDRLRPFGQKVQGLTCIPAGQYDVVLAESPRFGKTLPRLVNVPFFEGVLFHGGNRPEDSEGCILVGSGRKAYDWIFGSLSQRLVQALENKRGTGYVTIWNGPGSAPYLNGNGQNT